MNILFYCGINNLVNFNRIRPYYDVCYGFDANPGKIEYAKKIYQNDPGVNIIYGALTEKNGEEVEFTITTDWDPASSIGTPNPDYNPTTKIPHILAAQKIIKVPTINLYDFCRNNNISEIDTLITDLQGSDFTVLKTLSKFIEAGKIREIQCEVEPNNKPTRYLGIPQGKLKDFNNLLSEKYDILWIDPPGPPEDAWEMDVRWRLKGSDQLEHVEFVVKNELMVPVVENYVINFVYEFMNQVDAHAAHRGNVSVIWSNLPVEGCDVYVYTNAFSYKGKKGGIDILLMLEPAVVLPGEYDQRIWEKFDYIFGVFDMLTTQVDKFHKILFPRADIAGKNPVTEIQAQRESLYPLSNRKNAICMVGSNRSSHVPYELYSKRVETARWFAENSKMPFDVYGTPFALANYRGPCPSSQKLSMIKQYRYNLCFENTNHPILSAGYVTEKILDCLETRTVPIYLGASNIEKYIPAECFIDFRQLGDFKALDSYLHSISQTKYKNYIDNIDTFVCGGGLGKFSESMLCNEIVDILVDRKLINVGYINNHKEWKLGFSPSVQRTEWKLVNQPVMWTWKHLSKAEPPLLENMKIKDKRQNTRSAHTRSREEQGPKSFLIGKKPSVNILTVGAKFSSGNARQGYDYGWWNLFDVLKRFDNIKTHFFDYSTQTQQRGIAGMSEYLEDIVNREKPDLLFYSPINLNLGILHECLKYITDHTDTQTLIWLNYHNKELNPWASCANYLISTSPATTQSYKIAGYDSKIINSQWGFNPFTYAVTPSPRILDISFCGTAEGNRLDFLEKMKNSGLSVNVFGAEWHEDSFIPFYDLVKIFSQSRISLNFSDTPDLAFRQISRRTFEVPGCHGFLLTTPSDHLEEYYESGKEMIIASTPEELIDKAKYYLAHEQERHKIAACGYKRTIAEHTWSHRLVDIFKHIGFKAIPAPLPQAMPFFSKSLNASIPEDNLTPTATNHSLANCTDHNHNHDLTSVWVLAYNQLHYTRQCVESILHYTKCPFELLLVDHGSTDDTFKYFNWVKSFHPNTRIIKYFQNRIIEETCNYVFSIARGKYLAVVTNDVIVHEGWLENFIKHIESSPDIAVVGPRSNNISGPQVQPAEYNSLEEYQTFATHWSREHRGESFPIERMVGMCTLTKKDIYKRIGGGDPDLPTNGRDGGYGFSDDDFSLRLRLGRYRSLVANDVFIHHYGSVTVKQYRPDLFGEPQNVNKEKYIKKVQSNSRITIGTEGKMILNPYTLDEVIPVDERTIIRTPRICFAETGKGDDLSNTPDVDIRYAGVAKNNNGRLIQSRGETIQTLILKILDDKQYDFLVLIDSHLAPSPESISALAEFALSHPDVALMVPVGNYAPSTHAQKLDSAEQVELIPYADLSICAINLKIIRPLRSGLANCKNDDDFLWFLQRRVRGESYFIAKANDILVNREKPPTHHPYDEKILPEQLIKEKKYAEAMAIYSNDVILDPTFAQSYYQLACIAREQGQWKEAIKQAEQALLFDPHHIETLIFLSIIFMEQNDWKRAESFVRQANFKQPGNPDVQKIVEQYEKVIKENPDLLQKNDVCKIPDLTNTEFVKNRTSIIIAAASNHSRECITAIKKHTKELYELIVIDALASPDSKKKLKKSVKEHSPYRIMEHNAQDSLLQSINKAINCSTGEYIVLLNDDVIVSEGWLAGMLSCLNLAPSAGIIGPMTNKCKDRKQAADESYSSINNLDKYAAQFKEKYNHRRIPYRNIARFCMLFKRSLAEKIGLLDESFTAGRFDDEDFCWRSALADYQNYIAGDVFVHCHGENESSGNGNTIDQKWDISTATLDGKKMAVLKATELSDDLYSRGKVDQAVETLVDCIKITPEADKIYFELIRIFLETKKFGEAWAVIETMPDAAKNKIQTLEYSGYVKEGLGLDNEANDYADKILSSNENYSAALNLKGVLAFKKGEKDKALDYFKRAVNENPGCGDAYANLSVLYWKINSKEEAFVHIQKGFRLSPTVPDNQSIYHSMASSLGRFAAAEADFRKACRLYPHHKNLAFLVIDLLLQQGNLNSAILEIEDALDTFGLDEGTLNAALAVREKIGPLQVEPGTKNNTLSLCMIVKNEENNLVRCLKSIRDIVDEMIIVDTGSTDKTKVLSKIFGAKVYDFPWTGDFSAARNHSLAQAAGDWILILDADEIISALDHDELKTLVNRNLSSPAAYSFDTRNYIKNESVLGWTPNDGKYPEETHHGWMTTAKVRLFPRKKNVFFINPVHEIVDNSLQQAAIPIFNCNVVVHHYGKLDLLKDMQKGEDYYLLGKMKYESNPANVKYIHELAKQAHLLGKYEEAKELWLKLISILESDPQSQDYHEIARVSASDPVSETYMQLATAYLASNSFEEALAAARKAMEAEIKPGGSVYFYAISEIIAGSLEKASKELEDILKANPDYSPALFLTALVFCLSDEKDKANELFQSLRQKQFDLMTARLNNIAGQLNTYGKKKEASILLNAAVENKISDAETVKLLNKI